MRKNLHYVRLRLALLGLWLVYCTAGQLAYAQLSPAIMADRYLLQAERERERGDADAALIALDRILELQVEHDLNIPEVFWFRRAQLSHEADLPIQAIESATRYLEIAGRDAEHYVAALDVLVESELFLEQQRLAETNRIREQELRELARTEIYQTIERNLLDIEKAGNFESQMGKNVRRRRYSFFESRYVWQTERETLTFDSSLRLSMDRTCGLVLESTWDVNDTSSNCEKEASYSVRSNLIAEDLPVSISRINRFEPELSDDVGGMRLSFRRTIVNTEEITDVAGTSCSAFGLSEDEARAYIGNRVFLPLWKEINSANNSIEILLRETFDLIDDYCGTN